MEINNLTRFVSGAAALLTVTSALAACAESAQVPEASETLETTVQTTTEADNYAGLRGLSFDGKKVTMLIRDEFVYEFAAEKETGEVVNDAVYARDLAVEGLLNVELNYHSVPGSYPSREGFVKTYTSSVLANDKAYDMVASAANYMLPLTAKGYFVNLMDTENVSIDMPWYAQGYIENLNIAGRLYLTAGSASINFLENMCVLFFNKNLLTDLGGTLPYKAVKDGKWVFDTLNGLVKDCYEDVNGDGKVGTEDRLGWLTYNNMINAQLVGMGQHYISKDKDGIPHFASELDERTVEIYNAVEQFMNGLESTYHYNDTTSNALKATETLLGIWANGKVLFMPQVLSSAAMMRDTDFDFGILPLPKYNEAQESYRTFILENVTVMGIPPTAEAALSGAVLDALSINGYFELSPVYYEIALKEKYSRDTYTQEMLDVIRGSVSFEYPLLTQFMPQCIYNKSPLVSSFDSQKQSLSNTFDAVVKGCLELDA